MINASFSATHSFTCGAAANATTHTVAPNTSTTPPVSTSRVTSSSSCLLVVAHSPHATAACNVIDVSREYTCVASPAFNGNP